MGPVFYVRSLKSATCDNILDICVCHMCATCCTYALYNGMGDNNISHTLGDRGDIIVPLRRSFGPTAPEGRDTW